MTPQSLDKAESNLDHVAQACKPAGGVDAHELVHQTREPTRKGPAQRTSQGLSLERRMQSFSTQRASQHSDNRSGSHMWRFLPGSRCWMFVPQTVWAHWGVLTVGERKVCLDRCSAWACAANSLLFTVHSCLPTSSMCISTAQARRIWVAAAGASSDCVLVVVPCVFWCMVVTFRGRCKGNLVLWCSKVDFS